jgi:hypothetical protein
MMPNYSSAVNFILFWQERDLKSSAWAIAIRQGLPLSSHSWKATDYGGGCIMPKSGSVIALYMDESKHLYPK